MQSRYAKKVGTTLAGKWMLTRLLGSGSTSAVFEATPLLKSGISGANAANANAANAANANAANAANAADAAVAIKILHAHLCRDETVVRRFLREAYVSNAIHHRALVRVHEDGVSDGSVYLVLDLLEGETLEERRVREGGKLSFDLIAPLALELMSALSAVHSVGIVHRDLKPQNVLLTSAGEIKLLDFGTARIFDADGATPISIEGLVIGTPSFMSPEQARGERALVDAQSDIWSLGATLFTILSGEYVHIGRGAHQRLFAAATTPPRSLATVAPWLDGRITTVVDRALSFTKEERWKDVASMRSAFRSAIPFGIASGGAAEIEPPPPSSNTAPPIV